MRYRDYDPREHTVSEAPDHALTYAWNQFMAGKKPSQAPKVVYLGPAMYDWFAERATDGPAVGEPGLHHLRLAPDDELPDWGFRYELGES